VFDRGKKAPGKGVKKRNVLILRTVVFGAIMVALAVFSSYFVFGVISQDSTVDLSVSSSYTVRLWEAPQKRENELKSLAENPELKEHLGLKELFITRLDAERSALCTGRFDSKNSEDALQLLSKVRAFEYGENRPFKDAEIILIGNGRY